MWDLPGPGIEPVPPALAGGFLTIAPPGKSLTCFLSLKAVKQLNSWKGPLGSLARESVFQLEVVTSVLGGWRVSSALGQRPEFQS